MFVNITVRDFLVKFLVHVMRFLFVTGTAGVVVVMVTVENGGRGVVHSWGSIVMTVVDVLLVVMLEWRDRVVKGMGMCQ